MKRDSTIDIDSFLKDMAQKIHSVARKESALEIVKNQDNHKTQCLYVFDFQKNEVVFSKNTKLLGFKNHELLRHQILDIHPDDQQLVKAISKSTIAHGIDGFCQPFGIIFSLTYRLKKKDGTYLKVLRQTTILETGDSGQMLSSISTISDISFIQTIGTVNWTFESPGLDKEAIEKEIYHSIRSIFTARELEILAHVVLGETSQDIATQLFVSKHTVDTHRRNILKKSGCSNAMELREFCLSNNLI